MAFALERRGFIVQSAINATAGLRYVPIATLKNKAEVIGVILTEYNEDEVRQVFREEGYEEGYEEGRFSLIQNLMKQLGKGAAEVMDLMLIPASEREAIYKRLSAL